VRRSGLRIAVSLLLTAGLLALFLWNVDLSEVGHYLQRADAGLLVLACLLALVAYWLRAVRWQLILLPVGRVGHANTLLATAVGYAAMALLPARMGDLVRPLILAQRERKPASALLASILTERIFDLWSVLLFFLVFTIWPPDMHELDDSARGALATLGRSSYVVAAGLLAGTGVLLGLFRFQERFVAVVTAPVARFSTTWRDRLAGFLVHFLDGLRVLKRPKDLALTVGASLVIWMVIYLQLHVTLGAFSIDLPFRATYLLVTLTVLGLAIPTPGGVGGFHKAFQLGLSLFFAVELNQATGIAIVHHAICFVPITLIGLLCLPLFGVSMRTEAKPDEG
jgi:uncharacterized protein (TIRG00374 family)